MQDYLFNKIKSQDVKTINIYINQENFKTVLKTVYGELNEKRIIKL